MGDKLVYLIFDIDCLDFVFVLGMGMLVCGGLSLDKILKIICVLKGINLIGMDVVEVLFFYD